jgi:predicted RNA binding protein YcfA (HicA-like mRNA interferase family)
VPKSSSLGLRIDAPPQGGIPIAGCPMPRKIHQLIADLKQAGFVPAPGGKGSHRKFRHPRFAGAVILSGKEGDDAHYYQEKQVRNAVREVSQ